MLGEDRRAVYEARQEWFVQPMADPLASWSASTSRTKGRRLVDRFDLEWSAFRNVASADHADLFERYFDIVPRGRLSPGRVVLDAGCGAGRWAHEVRRTGARVIALDLGFSIEVARKNLDDPDVACVQGDICSLPLRNGSVDFAYSLGVLHHIDDTESALAHLVSVLRPGGPCLVYLYYALDNRSRTYRSLFFLVDHVRRFTSRLPQPLLVTFSTAIAALVYLPLARTSRLFRTIGLKRLSDGIPLSFYADLSFEVMRNDSLDRFGTHLEKRFSRSDVFRLLTEAGLSRAVVSSAAPFWHAVGWRPENTGN